jgi:hypothetical protein
MAVLERYPGSNVSLILNPSLIFANKMARRLPVLFFILFFWVFEIQLLMQIIINRIALIAEHRSTVTKLKWGTVALITSINVAVFIIWIPAHTVPPVSDTFVAINNVWDKVSKVLILIVDAGLNWYFLQTVKTRLVNQHGLVKYAPLVGFNAKLMVLSVAMDVRTPIIIHIQYADNVNYQALLIGLMFLKNQVVYIQFHPVVYIVKLNIEMSMASLVVRLAQGKPENDMYPEEKFSSTANAKHQSAHLASGRHTHIQSIQLKSNNKARSKDMGASKRGSEESMGGIHCQTDLNIVVEDKASSERSSHELERSMFGDDVPLHHHRNGQMHTHEV